MVSTVAISTEVLQVLHQYRLWMLPSNSYIDILLNCFQKSLPISSCSLILTHPLSLLGFHILFLLFFVDTEIDLHFSMRTFLLYNLCFSQYSWITFGSRIVLLALTVLFDLIFLYFAHSYIKYKQINKIICDCLEQLISENIPN